MQPAAPADVQDTDSRRAVPPAQLSQEPVVLGSERSALPSPCPLRCGMCRSMLTLCSASPCRRCITSRRCNLGSEGPEQSTLAVVILVLCSMHMKDEARGTCGRLRPIGGYAWRNAAPSPPYGTVAPTSPRIHGWIHSLRPRACCVPTEQPVPGKPPTSP